MVCQLSNTINKPQAGKTFHVVYHRGLFLDPCCFSFILMPCHKYLINFFLCYLLMIQICSLPVKKIIEIAKSMNEELQKISQWLKTFTQYSKNKLHGFFKHKEKRENIDLKIEGNTINQIHSTKFLGVTIDNVLSWESHVKQVRTKVAK